MKDRVGVRLASAALLVALAGAVVLAILASGFSSRHFGARAPYGYELGQYLGIVEDGVDTPVGIYRPSLGWLPSWLQPAAARLLHVELWIWALMLLPSFFAIASVAFDWAVDGGPRSGRRHDEYL